MIVYNTYEIENIESIIRSVFSQHKSFLIIDDNSPDHTADRSFYFNLNLLGNFLEKEPKNRVWEQLMFMDLNGH
jgi:dolichol-phosphate mannosyltransferase